MHQQLLGILPGNLRIVLGDAIAALGNRLSHTQWSKRLQGTNKALLRTLQSACKALWLDRASRKPSSFQSAIKKPVVEGACYERGKVG